MRLVSLVVFCGDCGAVDDDVDDDEADEDDDEDEDEDEGASSIMTTI